MTIHASKGLEFGYVIYAGLHRQLNMMDLSRKAAVHPDAGIAFKRYMPKHQAVLPSIHSEVLRRMVRRERISEEMRLVYVALTRAVHQLIIPLVYKDERKDKFSYEGGMVHADDRLAIQTSGTCWPPYWIRSQARHLKWRRSEKSRKSGNRRSILRLMTSNS
ncbi:3'-5' exonuclease [Salinicoccus sp. CNSTN-B1]